MKRILSFFLMVLFIGITSCREIKKDEKHTEEIRVEKVESVSEKEKRVKTISDEIEENEKELEKELNELDNI